MALRNINPKIFFLCFKSFIEEHSTGTIKALHSYSPGEKKKSECRILNCFLWGFQRLSRDRIDQGKKKRNSIAQEGVPLKGSLNFLINHETDMEDLLRHI